MAGPQINTLWVIMIQWIWLSIPRSNLFPELCPLWDWAGNSFCSINHTHTLLTNSPIKYCCRLPCAVADPGGVQQCKCTPFKKSKKNSFLAIFEGFWAHRPLLCVSYYWECPRNLDKVGRNSYKSWIKFDPFCLHWSCSSFNVHAAGKRDQEHSCSFLELSR